MSVSAPPLPTAAPTPAPSQPVDPDAFYVVTTGYIESCQIEGTDNLYCRYLFNYGAQNWTYIKGVLNGISQTALSSNTFERGTHANTGKGTHFVWHFPLSVVFRGGRNLEGWPQLAISVFGSNAFGVDMARGYGWVHLPAFPGIHTRTIRLYAPQPSSMWRMIMSFLTGNHTEYYDPKIITQNKGRKFTRVTSCGKVKVVFNVEIKTSKSFPYTLPVPVMTKTQEAAPVYIKAMLTEKKQQDLVAEKQREQEKPSQQKEKEQKEKKNELIQLPVPIEENGPVFFVSPPSEHSTPRVSPEKQQRPPLSGDDDIPAPTVPLEPITKTRRGLARTRVLVPSTVSEGGGSAEPLSPEPAVPLVPITPITVGASSTSSAPPASAVTSPPPPSVPTIPILPSSSSSTSAVSAPSVSSSSSATSSSLPPASTSSSSEPSTSALPQSSGDNSGPVTAIGKRRRRPRGYSQLSIDPSLGSPRHTKPIAQPKLEAVPLKELTPATGSTETKEVKESVASSAAVSVPAPSISALPPPSSVTTQSATQPTQPTQSSQPQDATPQEKKEKQETQPLLGAQETPSSSQGPRESALPGPALAPLVARPPDQSASLSRPVRPTRRLGPLARIRSRVAEQTQGDSSSSSNGASKPDNASKQ